MEVGTRCRVISDSHGFFEPGKIVIVLENDSAPFCAKESAYSPKKSINDYSLDDYSPLVDRELEVIGD